MDTNHLDSIYRLRPAYKDYLWGGKKLVELFEKDSPYEITAESWELSAHPDGISIIDGGMFDGMPFNKFIEEYGAEVCGGLYSSLKRFPILIKFIDASKALSVQVHPDNAYAFFHEHDFGKSEMWYVLDCQPGAALYCGFCKEVTKDEIKNRIEDGTLLDVLNKIEVHKGDTVFVPAGTVHAIGEGVVVCEIQQNSNCSYRLFDYNRTDQNGNKRELHIDKALDVLNLKEYVNFTGCIERDIELPGQKILCESKYFLVEKYEISGQVDIPLNKDSFKSLVILSGHCHVSCDSENIKVSAGDCLFISAGDKTVHVAGACELLAVYV